RPPYPRKITISLFFDIVRMPVSQLTGRSRTAALAVRGRDPAPGEADRADPDCARAGLPRSRHWPRGGEPAGQAEDSINGYRRSVSAGASSIAGLTWRTDRPIPPTAARLLLFLRQAGPFG